MLLLFMRVSAVVCVLVTIICYDRLIRRIREWHPHLWISMGQPTGLFLGSGAPLLSRLRVQFDFFFSVTFGRPVWVTTDNRIARFWRWYVTSYWVCVSFGVCLIVIEFSKS
jgi:hypothetical protein